MEFRDGLAFLVIDSFNNVNGADRLRVHAIAVVLQVTWNKFYWI